MRASRIARFDSYELMQRKLRLQLSPGLPQHVLARNVRDALLFGFDGKYSSLNSNRPLSRTARQRILKNNLQRVFEAVHRERSNKLCVAALQCIVQNANMLLEDGVVFEPQWLSRAQRMALVSPSHGNDNGSSIASKDNEAHKIEELCRRVAFVLSIPGWSVGDESETQLALRNSDESGGSEGEDSLSVSVGDEVAPVVAARSSALLQLNQARAAPPPNDSFVRYLQAQSLVSSSLEMQQLISSLRKRPLTAIRVHGTIPCLASVAEKQLHAHPAVQSLSSMSSAFDHFCGCYVVDHQRETTTTSSAGAVVTPAHMSSFRQLAQALLRNKSCSFQSVSSMLPCVLLSPQPGERILDMCAAPGSKTQLMVDLLCRSARGGQHGGDCRGGTVWANDMSMKRAEQLLDRVGGTHNGMIVTNGTGQNMCQALSASFDKVLVDAPCSGEGQLHRSPSEWRLWHPHRSLSFHEEQVSLLRRGVALLREGGIVVYSTCTLNPIENEAVVAAVVEEGLVEPVPFSQLAPKLEALKLTMGFDTWCVPAGSGDYTMDATSGSRDRIPLTAFCTNTSAAVRQSVALCSRRVMPHVCLGMEAFFMIALRRKSFHASKMLSSSSSASFQLSMQRDVVSFSRSILDSSTTFRLVSMSSSRLDRLLRPFLDSTSVSVTAVLQRVGLRPVESMSNQRRTFHVSNGQSGADVVCGKIILASESSVELLSASSHGSVSAEHGQDSAAVLLSMGTCVFDEGDVLTEAGARLLRDTLSCQRQVFSMPMEEVVQLLAAGPQGLTLSALYSGSDRRFAAGVDALRNTDMFQGRAAALPMPSWLKSLISGEVKDGNAIAVVSPDKNNASGEWQCPVWKETDPNDASVVVLRCSLPNDARRRAIAMMNQTSIHGEKGRRVTSATASPMASMPLSPQRAQVHEALMDSARQRRSETNRQQPRTVLAQVEAAIRKHDDEVVL